jgi:hypothetical protein
VILVEAIRSWPPARPTMSRCKDWRSKALKARFSAGRFPIEFFTSAAGISADPFACLLRAL